jgi:hypothetical protein
VGALEHRYLFPQFDSGPLRSAPAPIPQQYAQLEYQINAHNKRITQLRDIAKRLREAKSY